MKSAEYSIIHKHKLPPKLIELLKSSESSSIVGFGATKEQQDFMVLSAILASKNTAFFEDLTKEFDEYLVTLSHSLSVHSNN